MKWHKFDEKKPKDGEIIFVAFRRGDESYEGRKVRLCMYTPTYIVWLCEEDEGQWRGLGSICLDRAWAWMRGIPQYPGLQEDEEEK